MHKAQNSVYLSAISPRDKRWDDRKAENEDFQRLYHNTIFHSYVIRLANCSLRLVCGFKVSEQGICTLVIKAARFCRVPTCPICQARRCMKWQAKSLKVLPHLLKEYPKSRFLMLTLTVRNPHVTELRSQITQMNHAWRKLTLRKEFSLVQGWIKSIEVPRQVMSDDTVTNYVNVHFHCLLMVKPGYFSGPGYVTQERWAKVWQDCLKVDYTPVVDVRAVHPPKSFSEAHRRASVMSAVVEVIKYAVKPSELIEEVKGFDAMNNRQWLVEITSQLHSLKRVATGGILKEYYKILEDERKVPGQLEESDELWDELLENSTENLLLADETGTGSQANSELPEVIYRWNKYVKRYKLEQEGQE